MHRMENTLHIFRDISSIIKIIPYQHYTEVNKIVIIHASNWTISDSKNTVYSINKDKCQYFPILKTPSVCIKWGWGHPRVQWTTSLILLHQEKKNSNNNQLPIKLKWECLRDMFESLGLQSYLLFHDPSQSDPNFFPCWHRRSLQIPTPTGPLFFFF